LLFFAILLFRFFVSDVGTEDMDSHSAESEPEPEASSETGESFFFFLAAGAIGLLEPENSNK
jgi:hypothetical protein